MGRRKRVWYPGAIYHVMNRGNRKTNLFKDTSDYLRFLDCIFEAKESYEFTIHALCLMTNHFHIEIETAQTELWKIMRKMLHPYSMDFNHKYNFTGHLFEGRYTACLIEDERYFLEVSRYIHLNPVKAGIVNDPRDYEFSSYGMYIGDAGSVKRGSANKLISDLVDTKRVLSYFLHDPQAQYRSFVEEKSSHAEQESQIQKEMKEDDMWLP